MPFVSSVRGNYSGVGKRKTMPAESSTGGTITTAGGYRIHTFTTTGASTFTFGGTTYESSNVEYLIIAGGGSGWCNHGAGGGGAGGYRTGTTTLDIGATTVTVGAGRKVQPSPTLRSGGPSSFGPITSTGGGGGGGNHPQNPAAASPGGSGGGSGYHAGGGGGGAGSVGSPSAGPLSSPSAFTGSGAPGQGCGGGPRTN